MAFNRNVDVLVDALYGSSGKGQCVSKIAGDYSLMVRCGGANAGHSVRLGEEKIVFNLLPSGARHNTDVDLMMGPAAIIHPKKFLEEIDRTKINPSRIFIDPNAAIVTDDDIAYEREHFATMGSTCQGVGKATINKLMRTAWMQPILAKDCDKLKSFIKPALEIYAKHNRRMCLLEGTQGSLLSVHHGNHPYVTTRDTCVSGQLSDAGIPPTRLRKSFLVVRSMPIRVKSPGVEDIGVDGGYSGGFAGKELSWEEVSQISGISVEELKTKEMTTTTHRLRRVAEFNEDEFMKSIQLNGPTDLCLTFADYVGGEDKIAEMVNRLEVLSGVPVTMISRGFGTEFIEMTGRTEEHVEYGVKYQVNV